MVVMKSLREGSPRGLGNLSSPVLPTVDEMTNLDYVLHPNPRIYESIVEIRSCRVCIINTTVPQGSQRFRTVP